MIAYAETDIRYALARIPRPRIVKVYIPVLSPVGYAPRISDPYLFAIAFDAAATSSANGVSSRTYAQTCTGSNLMLIAGSRANSSGGTQTVTGVTYAAVGMTQRATYNDPVNFETNDYIHSLANPATGANNVIVSYSGTVNSVCGCSSYSGTNGVGNTGTNNANSGVESVSVTTTEANSYVVGVLYTNGMNPTVSGSTVQRAELQAANGHYINIADLAAGAAGAHALGWTSSSGTWSVLAIEVKALVSGPANLKSRDTNLKANIKTIDSNPIANVKSLDTNT